VPKSTRKDTAIGLLNWWGQYYEHFEQLHTVCRFLQNLA
jgi:hypothetical protein